MRLSIALLTILATAFPSTESTACCLTDWLFGRQNAPYAVGYAPYAVGYAPYSVGYAPIGQTYSAGYAPVATSPYVSGYSAVPATTSMLRPALNPAPMAGNGAYQAQRPTYYDNPSVYTGQPVTGNVQTSYSVPVATTLRGVAPSQGLWGAGNAYPSYQAGYANQASPGLPITTTTPTGAPVSALPATQVAPLFQTAPQPRVGGLRRFFGSWIGTNYRSSYYRAPVTYYRPVTSVDPVSGTTVTVQQPCSSYVQQLQRTPYSSLQAGQPAFGQPSAGYQAVPVVGGYDSYGQTSPYGATPSSGIGQVGAVGAADQFTVPIPSIAPATPGYYGQGGFAPNTSPLTGVPGSAPSTGGPSYSSPMAAPGSRGDLAPVDQPSLQGFTPSESSYRQEETNREPSEPSQPSPKSFWELQDAEDSTAMIRIQPQPQAEPAPDPFSLRTPEFTGASPIRAPEDYISPFRKQTIEAPTAPVTGDKFEAPQLPARTIDPSDVTSVSTRIAVPVREAALVRDRVQKPVPLKRDSTWYTIQP